MLPSVWDVLALTRLAVLSKMPTAEVAVQLYHANWLCLAIGTAQASQADSRGGALLSGLSPLLQHYHSQKLRGGVAAPCIPCPEGGKVS